ncbi:hypothetical protein HYH03_004977 [Edaphochlamys debaryana]|uniref:Uncharacterized protein n=1 Tax=Edaphochlamys debaryana TaxID=47281 RepID=A0A835YA07_9CHLO|nr:hypothetical protein HYH03_004977 [Edaphochlamys debaryana]|eukprot:KAG2496971.1 hypothetical protein HYH03_004977 [Edaphochlamys debaryana]
MLTIASCSRPLRAPQPGPAGHLAFAIPHQATRQPRGSQLRPRATELDVTGWSSVATVFGGYFVLKGVLDQRFGDLKADIDGRLDALEARVAQHEARSNRQGRRAAERAAALAAEVAFLRGYQQGLGTGGVVGAGSGAERVPGGGGEEDGSQRPGRERRRAGGRQLRLRVRRQAAAAEAGVEAAVPGAAAGAEHVPEGPR